MNNAVPPARNVEIKARLADPLAREALERRLQAAADGPAVDLHQDDSFFAVPHGRLKLRVERHPDGAVQARLIQYARPDVAGPKTSTYRMVELDPDQGEALREALTQACGLLGRVRKQRRLFLIGRMRVHVDDVEGLGPHLEFEVVLRPGEAEADGRTEALQWLAALGVPPADLLVPAYLDLLREASHAGGSAPGPRR